MISLSSTGQPAALRFGSLQPSPRFAATHTAGTTASTQPDIFTATGASPLSPEELVGKISRAVEYMSENNIGALIVVETQPFNEGERITEHGIPTDARLSAELIASIFESGTPLHDGALIIDTNHRIAEAKARLPMCNDPELPWMYGTRHQSAIGLTQQTNDIVILISEKTGKVKLVEHGVVHELNSPKAFREEFLKAYRRKTAD